MIFPPLSCSASLLPAYKEDRSQSNSSKNSKKKSRESPSDSNSASPHDPSQKTQALLKKLIAKEGEARLPSMLLVCDQNVGYLCNVHHICRLVVMKIDQEKLRILLKTYEAKIRKNAKRSPDSTTSGTVNDPISKYFPDLVKPFQLLFSTF